MSGSTSLIYLKNGCQAQLYVPSVCSAAKPMILDMECKPITGAELKDIWHEGDRWNIEEIYFTGLRIDGALNPTMEDMLNALLADSPIFTFTDVDGRQFTCPVEASHVSSVAVSAMLPGSNGVTIGYFEHHGVEKTFFDNSAGANLEEEFAIPAGAAVYVSACFGKNLTICELKEELEP